MMRTEACWTWLRLKSRFSARLPKVDMSEKMCVQSDAFDIYHQEKYGIEFFPAEGPPNVLEAGRGSQPAEGR